MSRTPNIAVDLRILDRPGIERTGIGRYALESLRSIHAARPEWTFAVHSNRPDLIADDPRLELVRTRWPTAFAAGRVAWLRLSATRGTGRRPDLWFAPAFVTPPAWDGPSVVTVHDLVFLENQRLYRGRLAAIYVERAVRRTARRASRVICPSSVIAGRVVSQLGVDPSRVATPEWGISAAFLEPREGRGGDYVLFVGRVDERKGLGVLADALRIAENRGQPLDLIRVSASSNPNGNGDPRIVVAPSDEELSGLYRGALALVYPSLSEGFGFPVAEAMSCGCPAIASDLPEIREWAADGPVYVPPGDPESLAGALLSLASDPGRRERISAHGREVVSGRTWDAYGESVAKVIEDALGPGQSRAAPATSV